MVTQQIDLGPLRQPTEPGAITARLVGEVIRGLSRRAQEEMRLLGVTKVKLFNPLQAAELGLDIQEGWQLKLTPAEEAPGFTQTLISPEGEEVSFTEVFVTSEGVWVTQSQIDVQPEMAVPVEFPEIAPLVSPTGRTMEQLLDQLAGEMPVPERIIAEQELAVLQAQVALTTLFPEEDITQVVESINENPDAFLTEVRELGRSDETEALLRQLGLVEGEINIIFFGQAPTELYQPALPLIVNPTTQDRMLEYFNDNPDTLRSNLITVGQNSDTVALVEAMFPGITPLQLTDYFSIEARVVENRAEERLGVTKGFWGDLGDVFVAGTGDLVGGIGSALKWLGVDGIGETLFRGGQFMQVYIAPDEFGEFKWEQLLNPRWVATRLTRMAPILMAFAVVAITAHGFAGVVVSRLALGNFSKGILSGIGGIIGRAKIGRALVTGIGVTAITRPIESAMEAGSAYDIAIDKGLSEIEARQVADKVFWNNMLLASVDIAQVTVAFLPTPARVFRNLLSRRWVKTAFVGGKLVFNGLTEGGEEVYQKILIDLETGVEIVWDAETQEVFALGTMAGVGMGSGGHIITLVSNKVIPQLTPEQKIQFDKLKPDFIAQGLPEDVATTKALDGIEATPELTKIVEKATEDVNKELTLGQIKPKTEADKVVVDQLKRKLDVEPVKPVKIPKAEPGLPEAGIQPTMLPAEVAAKEVRPAGRGRVVQISMEDQLKLEQARQAAEEASSEDRKAYEAQAEIEGLRATHEADPVETARFRLGGRSVGLGAFISIKEQAFPDTFIVKQAEALFPEHKFTNLTPEGRVPRDAALDDLVKKFNMTPDEIADRVMQIREEKTKIKQLESVIKEEFIEKPLTPKTELTDKQVAENEQLIGQPKLTLKQVDALVGFFADYLSDPNATTAWGLTKELRREARAKRAKSLEERVQELIISKGVDTETAIKQATQETMSGELPVLRTEYLQGLTDELRDALFAKVYHVLKNEPFEMMSTAEALTNALTGKPIPREPGVKGGSAYSRLLRVFGDQPKVIRMIDKMAKEKKSLENIIEGVWRISGQDPIPLDPKMVEYLRNLSTVPTGQAWLLSDAPAVLKLSETRSEEQIRGETDLLRIELSKEPVPVTKYEAPIEDAAKAIPLWPTPVRDSIVKVLKEIGWSPIDIGNFIRANKASFDFSFWRQQGPLIFNHPVTFAQANIEAWKSIWSQKAAEASWEHITRDPLFQIYDVAADAGFDFLRPLTLLKGTSQWRGVEEFGYLTGERAIPRFTMKIPWIKISSRAFITGANEHNWRIFKNHYQAMLKLNEKYASGELKLKEGQVFSVEKEMIDMARMLADFTQRASLGRAIGLAPAINALIFSPRATLGRILTPRHLISANPRIRLEAWRNITTFIGVIGGIVLLGWRMGLWEVERDPRSAEYMSIRIGNTRIDPWSGYRQFLVFFTRITTDLFTNRKGGISSVTGAEYEINPLGALTSFLRGKAAPLASILLDFWIGKNFIGEEVDIKNKRQWLERVSPFAIWDIYEAITENNLEIGLGVTIPAILGLGVQTYTGDWVENFAKLGLPKYEENLPYGLDMPKYDTGDFWADHSGEFRGVDPATLTEAKGFPAFIRALVEATIIKEHLRTLPNLTLVSLNADPLQGITFGQYYQMWRDREKLVAEGDEEKLKAFDADERTRNAHLGNISQRQYALLVEYHSITDATKQAEFLEEHKDEIGINLRHDWLKSHPKENAQLAVWGQAKVLTLEAYKETKKLLKELGIPDSAIPEFTLPPETSIETHFAYEDFVADGKHASWEAQLLLAKDAETAVEAGVESYVEWRGLTLSGIPLKALELKVKHRELFDEYNGYSNRDSPFYIEDKDDRTEARDKLRTDNPEWVDDIRRIEAIENLASDDIVGEWVERGRVVDEFGGGSSESKVWLVDHPEAWKWALEQELLTDDGSDWNVPVLRINAEWREQDDEYNAIKLDDKKEQSEARERYLEAHPEYAKARRRRDAWNAGFSFFLIEDYVEYYLLTDTEEQKKFLREHPVFYSVALELLGWQPRDLTPKEEIKPIKPIARLLAERFK